jgi:hypothetical protein
VERHCDEVDMKLGEMGLMEMRENKTHGHSTADHHKNVRVWKELITADLGIVVFLITNPNDPAHPSICPFNSISFKTSSSSSGLFI